MSEAEEEVALELSPSLYGTGLMGMFSDSLGRRYVSFLAVTVGVTVSQMSVLRAMESLSRNILQLFWGRLADRHGKKVFIAIGRILNGILIASMIFVDTPLWLMPLIIGVALCWSIVYPAWNSLLGDYTTSITRGTTIGRINALSQAGSLAAMIVAFFISINQAGETTPASFSLILAIAAGTSIISGLLSLSVKERPPVQESEELHLSLVFNDRRLRRYLLTNIVYGVGMAFAWPLYPFIIVDKLALKLWQIAAFSIFSSASSMFSQRYFGHLMDRIGRRPIIVFSRISMAVSPLFYIFAQNWVHIALAEVVLGLGMGAWMSSGPTYIIDLAPTELRATYLAANTAAFGVAAFAGNLLGGYITDSILAVGSGFQSIHTGLLISAALRFFTGILFIWIHETHSPEARE
ncbi:MAG: MFS transporter [Candidatus Bathyarchaeota archaeon]|jgi:MFS family permease